MIAGLRRTSLSPARQRFLALLTETDFGRIERLQIRGGEPLFTAQTRVIRTITFGRETDAKPDRPRGDWELKRSVVELFVHFDKIANGEIIYIDIKAGLPCFMAIEEPLKVAARTRNTPAESGRA